MIQAALSGLDLNVARVIVVAVPWESLATSTLAEPKAKIL
jgi:hypothetical protein